MVTSGAAGHCGPDNRNDYGYNDKVGQFRTTWRAACATTPCVSGIEPQTPAASHCVVKKLWQHEPVGVIAHALGKRAGLAPAGGVSAKEQIVCCVPMATWGYLEYDENKVTKIIKQIAMNSSFKHPEQFGVAAITGSPDEVRRQLDGINVEQVVAFTVQSGSAREAASIVETLGNLAPFLRNILATRHQHTLEAIVEALVPKMVPEPHELKEAAMLARARTAVLKTRDWMSAPQIAEVAGFSTTNPSVQPGKWKRARAIFAIRHNGVDYYPTFGLDPGNGYRPLKSMAAIIQVLAVMKDGWGMAYWFQSANSFLGGQRPQDLMASAPQRVLAAAEDEVQEIAHG